MKEKTDADMAGVKASAYCIPPEQGIKRFICHEVSALVRRTGDKAPYLLYQHIPLCELTADGALRSAFGENAQFRFVLCRKSRVVLLYGLHLPNGDVIYDNPLLTEKGAPMLPPPSPGDGPVGFQPLLRQQLAAAVEALRARPSEAPRDGAAPWRFAQTIVPRRYRKRLAAKRMLENTSRNSVRVSKYGASLGLISVAGPFFAEAGNAWPENVCCPPARWNQLKAPPIPRPLWEKLPLAVQWEQLQEYGGSYGHFVCEIRRLMETPFEQIFEPYLRLIPRDRVSDMREGLNDILEEFLYNAECFPPDTYLKAVCEWVRVCEEELSWYSDAEGSAGMTMAKDLLIAFRLVYGHYHTRTNRPAGAGASADAEQQLPAEEEADALVHSESPQEHLSGRAPLEDRLHAAGISSNVCGPLPLEGADIRRVFEAVDSLAGTGYYTWSLRQKRAFDDPEYERLPENSKVKQLEKLLGGRYAEYAWEFPALFGIDDPCSDFEQPAITYDGMLANLYDGLSAGAYQFFWQNEHGLSPYSLVYELMAAPLLSVAAAQEAAGRQ